MNAISAKEAYDIAVNIQKHLEEQHYEEVFKQIQNACSNGMLYIKNITLFEDSWINSVKLLLDNGYNVTKNKYGSYNVFWDKDCTGHYSNEFYSK